MIKTKRFTRDKTIGLVGLIIVIGIGVYVGVYRPYSVGQDKERFLQAQASLEELYSQIEAKIGKPDEIKRDQSCDRANLKSSQGPLLCDVGISMWYKNRDVHQSNSLMRSSISLNSTEIRIGSGSAEGKAFVSAEIKRGLQVFYQSINSFSGLSCAIGYRYPTTPSLEEQFNSKYDENFEIHISCGGPAKAEHFPLKN